VSQAILSVSADPGSATSADAAPLAGAQPECAPGLDGATHECRVAGAAGGTWAWIMVISAAADTAKERVEAAQKAVSALLLQTRVAPAWSAPTGSWSQIDGCAALGSDIDVSRAVGAAGPGSWADDDRGDAVDPIAHDDADRGALDCTWQADNGGAEPKSTVFVTIAPAAEWAWPQLDALPGVTSTPLDVAGTDAASFRCASDAGTRSCWGDALVDHAWVQVSDAYGIDQQEATALLSAVVAGHAAS
jgi:hypothetical protein